jgi:lipoate-protein ligase A
MATRYHNISGELTQELLAAGDNVRVSSVSLSNIHASTTCTVDLYIEKKLTGKFYIMKGVSLPVGVTLSHSFSINNSANEFGLYIKLTKSASETPTVDVILQ